MKQAAIAAGVLAFGLAGQAFAKDNHDIVKTYDLGGFDKISVAGVYDLDVRVGPKFSIELSGSEYEMSLVELSVKDGVLHLNRRERKHGDKRWGKNNDGVDATITMPALNGLEVSGVVDADIVGIDAKTFAVDISGVGDVDLDGDCGAMEAHVSGVGELDAKKLECKSVDINMSGVGDADVFASKEVDAHVSGMGDIDVYGSPSRVKKSSGMFSDVTIH